MINKLFKDKEFQKAFILWLVGFIAFMVIRDVFNIQDDTSIYIGGFTVIFLFMRIVRFVAKSFS